MEAVVVVSLYALISSSPFANVVCGNFSSMGTSASSLEMAVVTENLFFKAPSYSSLWQENSCPSLLPNSYTEHNRHSFFFTVQHYTGFSIALNQQFHLLGWEKYIVIHQSFPYCLTSSHHARRRFLIDFKKSSLKEISFILWSSGQKNNTGIF